MRIVTFWIYRKATENDHHKESAIDEWDIIPIEINYESFIKEWEVAGINKAAKNGFITSQKHREWSCKKVKLSSKFD